MAVRRVQLRRGSTGDHTNGAGFTGAVGEITVDTTTKSIRVHDGAEAGGFDLMRADMSNNLAVVGNINFTDAPHVIGGDINTAGNAANILDLGDTNTTIRVRGTLNVNTQVTQQDLLISERVIVLADGKEVDAHTTDSIGVLFTRPLATVGEGGGAQDPGLFYWDEDANLFRLETNNVTEGDADWRAGATGADLTLRTLYAQTSVDVNDNNITNVGEIQLDSIIYNDDLNTITIKAKDDQAGAFVVKADAGDSEEYISINATDATESLTLGVPSREITLRGNLTTLGTNANPGVNHTIQVETTTLVAGQDLTIEAGTTSLAGNTSGGDLILSTGGGTGAGTASMQFKTLVANGLNPAERMRIHTDGNVGINENAPETLLHISGADTAILTLENTTGGNAQDDDPTTISFKGSGEALALAEIVGAHDGVADDDKGVLIFKPNNDAGPTEALRLASDLKATFAGAVEVATTLDMTDGNINNVATLFLDDIQCHDGVNVFSLTAKNDTQNAISIVDADARSYLSVDARDTNDNVPNLILGQPTNLSSSLTVTGTSNLDGGIAVDTNKFTVAGDDTGNTATKGTLTVSGDTVIGVATEGSPNLSVVNNAGTATFSVTGLTGNTEVAGTTTLSNTLNIVQGVVDGIVFNSDRLAQADQDAALLKVLDDNGNNAHGVLTWDDGLGSFSFSGSKLNSVLDITVGALGSTTTTISASTGAINTEGTTPYLTLKNTDGGNADGDSETRVIFQDDAGQSLAQIQGSHDGGANDTKGDLIFSTNSGGGLSEALRLDSTNLATFASNVKIDGNNIQDSGGNTSITFAGDGTLITLTATTSTVSGNLQVNGNITGDANEAKEIFIASVAEASTITLGGGGKVITGGDLQVNGTSIDVDAASVLNIGATVGVNNLTLGGATTPTVVAGHLNVSRLSANNANITLGTDAAVATKIEGITATTVDGNNLTLQAGGTSLAGNQNGGNLVLASGFGRGTGTSDIAFQTKVANTNDPRQVAVLKGSGRLGLGEADPDTIFHVSHATAPVITLQNTTAGDAEGDRASTLTFRGTDGAATEAELAKIVVSHSTANQDSLGKMVFSINNTQDGAVGSILELTESGGEKLVSINANLQVTGTTTTVNTATLDVEDAVIRLNRGVDGGANGNDIGIFFERGTDGDDGIFFYADDEDIFVLGKTTTDDHTSTDFYGTTTPGDLQIGALILKDNVATALDIKRQDPDGTSMLKFVTTNGSESIVFGNIFTAQTGSQIGNVTYSNDLIQGADASDLSVKSTQDIIFNIDSDNNGAPGAHKFSFQHNAGAEIASLSDQGLFSLTGAIEASGASQFTNTLNITKTDANAFVVEQDAGQDVFKVDTTNSVVQVDATSVLKTDVLQATTTGGTGDLVIQVEDNVENALVIEDATNGLDFITIDSRDNAELIHLVQDTRLRAEVGIYTANADGIFFNVDGSGNASADSVLMTIEGGTDKNEVVLAWDTSDNAINLNAESSLHLQGLGGANAALTIGGALVANATISMTSAGKITATTVASDFASGTKLGNVTYSDNEIEGADNQDLTIKSEQDLIFQVDSDQGVDVAGNNSFFFKDGGASTILTLAESGDLTTTGDLTIATTKSITLNSGAAGADADIVVDRTDGNNAILRWVEANDRFEIDNADGNLYAILTENDTLFKIKGADDIAFTEIKQTNGTQILFDGLVDAINDNQGFLFKVIGDTVQASFANVVEVPGTFKAKTSVTSGFIESTGQLLASGLTQVGSLNVTQTAGAAKTAITFNSDNEDAPADAEDVSIAVERGTGTNATLTWDEGDDRWTLDQGEGSTNAIVTVKRSEGARPETVGTSENLGGGDLEFTNVDRLDLTGQAPTTYENEHIYFLDNNGTIGTVDLFTLAGTTYNGYKINFVNTDTVNMVIDAQTQGGQTINGQNTQTIPSGGTLSIVAFGTSWFIL